MSLGEFVAAIDEGDGNLYAVGCGGVDALAGIEGAIEAAGDFLLLEERGFARLEVVLVDRARGDEGLVAVAEGGCFQDAVDAG